MISLMSVINLINLYLRVNVTYNWIFRDIYSYSYKEV